MERYARAFFKKLSLFTVKTIKSYPNGGISFGAGWRKGEALTLKEGRTWRKRKNTPGSGYCRGHSDLLFQPQTLKRDATSVNG
jgi:hypothetical protein